ncbi:MAG: response regulator, partial [Nannocystaceae bacterium]
FQTSTGYSRSETSGVHIGDLLSGPNAAPEKLSSIRTHIREGKTLHIELLCQRASGSLFWNSINISPVRSAGGDITQFIAVLSDISDRKMNEAEMLRAKREAEDASKSKSEFLAVMSHEIRTPLNAILGLTELALQGNLPAEHRSLLRSVQANSEVLTSILRDVLDFSRIEARQTTIAEEPFSLLEVTESVADALSVHAEAKGLDLVCYCDPRIPNTVRGDADHLRQVLINLIGNAIKFTDQGEILLETTAQDLSAEKVTVQIVVEDTGVGIPKAQSESIFDRFVQADQSTRRQFGGTGLGLSITRSLVELMGGSIRVDSVVGTGSRFTIDLSLPVVENADSVTSKSTSVFGGIKAIICENNLQGRHAVERLLTHWGVNVTTSDSVDAVHDAISGVIDVDVLMVDFSLYQSHQMRHSRRRSTPPPTPQCHVMVLCRSSDLEPRLLEDPLAKYITKPIRQENLRLSLAHSLRIEQLTNSRTPLTPSRERVEAPTPHKILLIEDNLDNRKLTTAMLEKNGMVVEGFENGADAIEAFSNSDYDMILTDLEMPGMDGVQVAQRIRTLEKRLHTKRTPIVAVTAHALVSFQERCIAAGMDALFAKLDELLVKKPNILIVDDSADARAIAVKILSAEKSYEVEAVDSGPAAIEAVSRRRYDLVVLDMMMPDLDGAETLTQLKAQQRDLRVIAMSALGRRELQQKSPLFDGQIRKPLRHEEFLAVVKQQLRHVHPRKTIETELDQRSAPSKTSGTIVKIDPDILKLVPAFLESRVKDVTTLRDSLGSGDLEVARRIGHTLKGVGASYGFPEITVFGQKIERAVIDGRLKEARAHIDKLESYLAQVVVEPA